MTRKLLSVHPSGRDGMEEEERLWDTQFLCAPGPWYHLKGPASIACQHRPLRELCWQQALPVLSAAVASDGCKLPWASLHSAVIPESSTLCMSYSCKLTPNSQFSSMARMHGSQQKACCCTLVHVSGSMQVILSGFDLQ